ncbi:hypothetical protein ABUT75_002114 [Flavobacterium psychrophilum]
MRQKRRQVCLFLFAYRDVVIDFTIGLMPIFLKNIDLIFKGKPIEATRHQADGKAIYLVILANKKRHSCWLIWFCGCLNVVMNGELTIINVVVMEI